MPAQRKKVVRRKSAADANQTYALLHLDRWTSDQDEIDIGPGVTLFKMAGTDIERKYEALCFEQHVDDGEPFGFDVCVAFDRNKLNWRHWEWCACDECSPITAACNLFAVFLAKPVPMVRVIWDSKNIHTHQCFALRVEEFGFDYRLDASALDGLPCAWRIATNLNPTEPLSIALTSFYRAWRCSDQIDQFCVWLNASIHSIEHHLELRHQSIVYDSSLDSIVASIIAGKPHNYETLEYELVALKFSATARRLQTILMDDHTDG